MYIRGTNAIPSFRPVCGLGRGGKGEVGPRRRRIIQAASEPGPDRYIIDNVRDGLLCLNVRIVSSVRCMGMLVH